jgi:DNA-directed RNA polymerase subunit L
MARISELNIIVENLKEEDGKMTFTISNVDVSYINAIRRIILSEIPIVGFKTTPYEQNTCVITANTTRLNNEVVKQRLSCIPICMNPTETNLDNYVLEVNVENNTDTIVIVTTEDFKIKNIATNKYLDESSTRKIFPPFYAPNGQEYFIDFLRLRPRISDEIPGEKIQLTCKFSIVTAKEDSMFNVVGTCSYGFQPDKETIARKAEILATELKSEGKKDQEIEFIIKNWKTLDGLRYVFKNSFNFVLESIGIFENETILIKACKILFGKMSSLKTKIETDEIEINKSNMTTMRHCYDIILENEDYTVGNILNYELYQIFYEELKKLEYVGFMKNHPHDDFSIVRIAFVEDEPVSDIKTMLVASIDESIQKIQAIKSLFKSNK